jgi:hypothetical protein
MPFLIAKTPQLTDYPSHLARYYIMLDGGHNPFLARYYDFKWSLTGNLGADLLIWPLAKLFGLEAGGRVLGLIIPPLTGLGIIAVEWVLRRRIGLGAMLAFAFIWSPAMGMGFYNFCLSLALALLSFALWVKLEGWPRRWALYIPIGLTLWSCHASGWGVLGRAGARLRAEPTQGHPRPAGHLAAGVPDHTDGLGRLAPRAACTMAPRLGCTSRRSGCGRCATKISGSTSVASSSSCWCCWRRR